MNFPESVSRDVCVDFSGADAGMAEQFLNDSQVGAVFKEVGCKAVPERMRGDGALDAGAADPLFDAIPHCDGGEGRAAFGEKDIGRRLFCHQLRAGDLQVALQRLLCLAANRHHAFLVAFANYIDEARFQAQLFEPQIAKL